MAKKKEADAKAKAKRQKTIAIVGGVLLLGLLAFQLPRTLKMLHPKSVIPTSTAAQPATTSPAGVPLAPPTLDGTGGGAPAGSSAAGAAAGGDGLVDPSASTSVTAGQLVNFDRFRSKDPFAQQIEDCSTACSSSASAGSSAGSGSASSATGGVGSMPAGASGSSQAPTSSPSPGTKISVVPQAVTTASISVNGAREAVAIGKDFPAASPTFVLLSLTRTVARIGIAGGSYESGSTAIKLPLGHSVTLQNTADGSRYVLRLLATS